MIIINLNDQLAVKEDLTKFVQQIRVPSFIITVPINSLSSFTRISERERRRMKWDFFFSQPNAKLVKLLFIDDLTIVTKMK